MNSFDPESAGDPLRAHSDRIAGLVDRTGAATVAVLGRRGAIASGCVWRPGLVVTAAHVFRRTPAALALVDASARSLPATLVGIDSATDLALFRLADDLPTVSPGDASTVRAGHLVIVVGRGEDGATLASSGLVNRVGGAWQTWLGGSIDCLVRLDGGVYDGLSGAPVVDAAGAVIGIATAALSRSYGMVVPSSTVARVVDALLANGRVARPWLGIGAQTVPLPEGASAAAGEKNGLLVTSLAAGGPAERAGLLIGDIIVRAAEGAAANLRELRQALAAHVGKTVALAVLRGGSPLALQASVGEWQGERRCC